MDYPRIDGQNWGCIYDKADVVKEIVARGHQVGSHTWSHAHLPSLSASQSELRKLPLLLLSITDSCPLQSHRSSLRPTVSIFLSQVGGDCFIYVVVVAIKEITGVDVAFMRPRE